MRDGLCMSNHCNNKTELSSCINKDCQASLQGYAIIVRKEKQSIIYTQRGMATENRAPTSHSTPTTFHSPPFKNLEGVPLGNDCYPGLEGLGYKMWGNF